MASTDLSFVTSSEFTGEGKEIINDVSLTLDSKNCVPFSEIVKALKDREYYIPNSVISYYSDDKKAFIYAGKYDYIDNYSIPKKDAFPSLLLKIRVPRREQSNITSVPEKLEKAATKGNGLRRNKERKIGDIIEKVNEWRQLYTGSPDESGNLIKYSLEKAALKVGIAKKTLDDYLLQLRAGKKYGFDFQIHKDSKVGALRAFVKEHKKSNKAIYIQNEVDQGMIFHIVNRCR